jgi:hypothetical protein
VTDGHTGSRMPHSLNSSIYVYTPVDRDRNELRMVKTDRSWEIAHAMMENNSNKFNRVAASCCADEFLDHTGSIPGTSINRLLCCLDLCPTIAPLQFGSGTVWIPGRKRWARCPAAADDTPAALQTYHYQFFYLRFPCDFALPGGWFLCSSLHS